MLNLSSPIDHTTRVSRTDAAFNRTTERLSSGLRINRAADDPGGLALSESLRTQVRGNAQAASNIQDGIHIVKIGEDGVQSVAEILQRLRELIVQAANGTNSATSLDAIQAELDATKKLALASFETAHQFRIRLDGVPFDVALDIQVGANQGDTIRIDYEPIRAALIDFIIPAYGYDELYADPEAARFAAGRFGGGPLPDPNTPVPPPPLFPPFPPGTTFSQAFPKQLVVNPNDSTNIANCFNLIDEARIDLTREAAYLGATHNRLSSALANVQTGVENLASAESRIRDTDQANESAELARAQIVQQSAISMMAQGTTKQQSILKLLRETTGGEG